MIIYEGLHSDDLRLLTMKGEIPGVAYVEVDWESVRRREDRDRTKTIMDNKRSDGRLLAEDFHNSMVRGVQ